MMSLAFLLVATAAPRAATAPRRWQGDRPFGVDRLHFDDREACCGGIQSELCRLGAAPSQDVQDELLAVERPLDIEQLQIKIPFLNPPLPHRKRLVGGTPQLGVQRLVSRRCLALDALSRLIRGGLIGVRHRGESGSRSTENVQALKRRPQLQSAMRVDDDTFVSLRRFCQIVGETGDLGNHPIADQNGLAHFNSMQQATTFGKAGGVPLDVQFNRRCLPSRQQQS